MSRSPREIGITQNCTFWNDQCANYKRLVSTKMFGHQTADYGLALGSLWFSIPLKYNSSCPCDTLAPTLLSIVQTTGIPFSVWVVSLVSWDVLEALLWWLIFVPQAHHPHFQWCVTIGILRRSTALLWWLTFVRLVQFLKIHLDLYGSVKFGINVHLHQWNKININHHNKHVVCPLHVTPIVTRRSNGMPLFRDSLIVERGLHDKCKENAFYKRKVCLCNNTIAVKCSCTNHFLLACLVIEMLLHMYFKERLLRKVV